MCANALPAILTAIFFTAAIAFSVGYHLGDRYSTNFYFGTKTLQRAKKRYDERQAEIAAGFMELGLKQDAALIYATEQMDREAREVMKELSKSG